MAFFFLFLVSSGKPEQEELRQRLQHPPAPREQAVRDGEVGVPVQEERWVRAGVTPAREPPGGHLWVRVWGRSADLWVLLVPSGLQEV